jgi:hypothetical protein
MFEIPHTLIVLSMIIGTLIQMVVLFYFVRFSWQFVLYMFLILFYNGLFFKLYLEHIS